MKPPRELGALAVRAEHLAELQALLRRHAPEVQALACGSRVVGGGHDCSDLDLVLRHPERPEAPTEGLEGLREAFSDSSLPFLVDLHDWAHLPAEHRRNVEAAHVLLADVEQECLA